VSSVADPQSVLDELEGTDRLLIQQVFRPIANEYRISVPTPGSTEEGRPLLYVKQKKMKIKEDIRFYGDETETNEIFRIKARSMFDMGSARYDVFAGEQKIGLLWHKFKESLLRTTWHVGGPSDEEVAIARERSQVGAIARRVADFVPVGDLIPIPYNFEILVDGTRVGGMDRKFKLRDQYILDLSDDTDKKIDRRLAVALAVGLDTLQNR
jgi:uncharacterized protein YxjI